MNYRIPATLGNSYLISKQGSNSFCLDFSKFINIHADGLYGALKPATGTTVNTVYIAPDPGIGNYAQIIDGLALGNPLNGTRDGLNGIFLDTQTAGSNLAKSIFSRMVILKGTGAGFLHINNPTNNINGGMYACSIENNVLNGGINLQGTGDSNTAHKNLISGPNVGIYLSNTAGASLFSAVDNNITTTAGAFKIDAGSRFKLLRNNCEQTVAFTGGAQYMVDISGANGTISTPEIRSNHFGLFSGITNSGVLHLSNTINALVENNCFLNSNPSAIAIVIDANNTNARIGSNTYGSAVTTKVVDNGTGTMGVIKPITTFVNAWTNSPSAPTSQGRFLKDLHGIVHLAGTLANGTTTAGTLMFTLPSGFRPDQQVKLPVLTRGGGVIVAGEIWIDTSGNVTIQGGQNQYLSLDGLTFLANGLADSVSDL
jgi:hypothetical protein